MMGGLIFLGSIAVVVCILRLLDIRRIRALDRFAATADFRQIRGGLDRWAAENPDKNFSHPEAQAIIRACIKRMARCRNANLNGDAEKHIAELIKLLN